MDKYIKLDVIGKGCNGNSVALVKNLDDNKVKKQRKINKKKLDIRNEANIY
jgi:hypothetical protein